MRGLPIRRFATLLVINLVGSALLFPAFGHILYFDLRGIPKLLAITWLGVAVLGLLLWPQVSRVGLSLALFASLSVVYLPASLAWAIVMRRVYFEGVPTPGELYSLCSSAAVIGGLFTAAFWLPLSLLNCWVLRRAA